MWNLFRRWSSARPFPKPEWPPIQALDRVDLVTKRRDGSVDLAIIASQPLDDAPETLESIRKKVNTYLSAIGSDEFKSEMGHPPLSQTMIIIVCDFQIHRSAADVIEECKLLAHQFGVRLMVRKK